MANSELRGIDVQTLMATASAQPQGSQKAKYCADVATTLGSNPIYEIQVGGVVKYRTTISGSLTSSSSGISLPAQFVEPPTINVADELTDAVEVIRNASNPSIEIRTPLKEGGGDDHVSSSKDLDGNYYVRASGRILVPPSILDVGGGSTTTTPLQLAMEQAMENPPGREGRVVHGPNADWSSGYPQPTWYPPGYTQLIFSQTGLSSTYGYGAGNTRFLPWFVCWDEATTSWGSPHVTNPANRKVAIHVRDWYTFVWFKDTQAWIIASHDQLTNMPEAYDGYFGPGSNQPAGVFPPNQRVTWSDGTRSARLINESGITSPSQVRQLHGWSVFWNLPTNRHTQIGAYATAFKARLEPVGQADDGTVVGGTASDVANARILCWNGADHYPVSGSKPDVEAIMQGRPRILTGDYQWYCSWVRDSLPLTAQWIQDHPLPVVE